MPTTKPTPKGALAKEPAGTIGTAITTILAGIWLVLKALGVDIADDLPTAIDFLVGGLLMVPAITGWLTRFFVVSPAGATQAVNAAAETGNSAAVDPMKPETWSTSRFNADSAPTRQ